MRRLLGDIPEGYDPKRPESYDGALYVTLEGKAGTMAVTACFDWDQTPDEGPKSLSPFHVETVVASSYPQRLSENIVLLFDTGQPTAPGQRTAVSTAMAQTRSVLAALAYALPQSHPRQ